MAAVTLTVTGLADLLASVKGHTFAGITVATPGRLVKKHRETKEPNPYANARKLTEQSIAINFVYDSKLEKELASKGMTLDDYTPSKGGWHQVITRDNGTLTPLCRHKERTEPEYLWYLPMSVSPVTWIDDLGQVIPTDAITPYLPAPSKPQPIPYRIIDLTNIKALRMNGNEYVIVS